MKGNAQIHARFIQYGGQLHISTVTLGELIAWVQRASAPRKRAEILEELLDNVKVMAVDEDSARRFGDTRAWQLDHGIFTPDLDLLNAAVALARGLTVV